MPLLLVLLALCSLLLAHPTAIDERRGVAETVAPPRIDFPLSPPTPPPSQPVTTPADAPDVAPPYVYEEDDAERYAQRRRARKANRWRAACVVRLKKRWVHRLARAGYTDVKVSSTHDESSSDVRLAAALRGVRVQAEMYWTPEECDAGAPTSWHNVDSVPPIGGDYAPRGAKWPLLAAAGADCFAVREFTER